MSQLLSSALVALKLPWMICKQMDMTFIMLYIQKTKIMASNPVTSGQINGGKVETMTYFTFLGSKITVDSECSQEIKRSLLLERKAMTNLTAY